MSEEKKLSLAEIEDLSTNEVEGESWFNFQNLYTLFILNWKWFAVSLVVFLVGAYVYLKYTSPVYSVSAKMLIKDDKQQSRRGGDLLANMQDFGFMSNSSGFENEMEILQSRILVRDAVKDLKLYANYYSKGLVKEQIVYGTQPGIVDIDETSLDNMDKVLLEESRSIDMRISSNDEGIKIEGALLKNGVVVSNFTFEPKQLPATYRTDYGTLSFKKNPKYTAPADGKIPDYRVVIMPPMQVAAGYLGNLSVAATSKQTSIAQLTFNDANVRRGLDFLRALVVSYNRQANADKNEVALKTEEFINDRIKKINEELGHTEGSLEKYKKQNTVTNLQMDASQSLQMSTQYSTKLAEANSQIQLLDYLREFVDNPSNQYKIIPSNVGMTDGASTSLISSYNKTVQERNRLLKVASDQAPQVIILTSTLDELQGSIRTALLQARRTADIQRRGIQNEYAKYQGRLGSTPEQERVLTEIGRQQEVRSGLYLMLLQKREENSISLAATADKGKLIDDPQSLGQVKPKKSIIMMAAFILGLALPLGILFVIQMFKYKLEGHDDLEKLTKLPIIADVPVASDSAKTAAGIVVHENKNTQMDEVFRSLRTNIQFMLKEHENTILFTSSASGEGKTFLAANLAVSFALLGKKVILCGLDIRKPALGKLFDIQSERKVGVSKLLAADKVTLDKINDQVVKSGINDNLDLLLAGPIPPNPTELLARENLKDTLDILKEKYDYVILDTAPVGLVTDTLQVAKFANVCCYVTRADYTPKTDVGIVNSLALEQKLPNPCVVLNGVDMSKKKYGYYYGYGTYGKYGKYGRYGYGSYGKYGYGGYGRYGAYGNYADSRYGNKDDDSIKK
ncbi:tyrosine-protein kinase [Prevotella sp. P6B1]|uniref:GumC family protein n=1 Tax=Prevotella sp. P6B1 TaxID=1410613 RepID=UPI00051C2922|nr:tyrosine-protein kinase [Prevotella sp. P6B1]